MNRDNIVEFVIESFNSAKQETQLLLAIEDAVLQIKVARELFESVSDPKLVDCAIYMEEAAKSRYSFLISEARRLNVKTNHQNVLMEPSAV